MHETHEDTEAPPTLRRVMTANVCTVPPETSLQQAAMQMHSFDIGFLPVVDASGPLGVVTDRDLAIRGAGRRLDPVRTSVIDIMTPNVASIPVDAGIQRAAQVMRDRKIRRVVVVDDRNDIAGVVSLSDLLGSGLATPAVVEVIDSCLS